MTELYHQIGMSVKEKRLSAIVVYLHGFGDDIQSLLHFYLPLFILFYFIYSFIFHFSAELNDIKYSAYRTAMKLRCIQRASSRKF